MSVLSRLLILHPSPEGVATLAEALEAEGLTTRGADSVAAGLRSLEASGAEMVLTAPSLADGTWSTLLPEVARRWPQVPVVLLTDDPQLGARAVQAGAADYCPSDASGGQLLFHVRAALAHARHRSRRRHLEADTPTEMGVSTAWREALAAVEATREETIPVLITGEEGTGKGHLVRLLHQGGPRAHRPLLSVDAEALPESFLELELAGYGPGAFPGDVLGHPGRAELADGGLLQVHDPHRLSRPLQARLLRLVRERTVVRRDEETARRVDVRLVATGSAPPWAAPGSARFSESLQSLLQARHIHLPPLRERPEDIPVLTRSFLAELTTLYGVERALTDEAIALVARQGWRGGNIRRLRHFVERLVLLGEGPRLGVSEVERELTRASSFAALAAGLGHRPEAREVERRILLHTLERTGGDHAAAARVLDVPRRTLYERLADQGLLNGLPS